MGITVRRRDPETGDDIAIARVFPKGRKPYYMRLPPQNHPGGITQRMMEQRASFMRAASSAYGKTANPDPPVWAPLKTQLPKEALRWKNPKRSEREEHQRKLAALVSPELRQLAEEKPWEGRGQFVQAEDSSVRFVGSRGIFSVPLPELPPISARRLSNRSEAEATSGQRV